MILNQNGDCCDAVEVGMVVSDYIRPNCRKRQLEVPPDPRAHFERRSEFIESIFNQPCLSEMEKFFVANRKNKTPIWTETDLNQKLDEVT